MRSLAPKGCKESQYPRWSTFAGFGRYLSAMPTRFAFPMLRESRPPGHDAVLGTQRLQGIAVPPMADIRWIWPISLCDAHAVRVSDAQRIPAPGVDRDAGGLCCRLRVRDARGQVVIERARPLVLFQLVALDLGQRLPDSEASFVITPTEPFPDAVKNLRRLPPLQLSGGRRGRRRSERCGKHPVVAARTESSTDATSPERRFLPRSRRQPFACPHSNELHPVAIDEFGNGVSISPRA
jgi:hypothetical protein